jgi:hypothetical protein
MPKNSTPLLPYPPEFWQRLIDLFRAGQNSKELASPC